MIFMKQNQICIAVLQKHEGQVARPDIRVLLEAGVDMCTTFLVDLTSFHCCIGQQPRSKPDMPAVVIKHKGQMA